jgi:hypothetical protein
MGNSLEAMRPLPPSLTTKDIKPIPRAQDDNLEKIQKDIKQLVETPLKNWQEKIVLNNYKNTEQILLKRIQYNLQTYEHESDTLQTLNEAYIQLLLTSAYVSAISSFLATNTFPDNSFLNTFKNPLPQQKELNESFELAKKISVEGIKILDILIPSLYHEILRKPELYINKNNQPALIADYFNACINVLVLLAKKTPTGFPTIKHALLKSYEVNFNQDIQNNIKESYFDATKAATLIFDKIRVIAHETNLLTRIQIVYNTLHPVAQNFEIRRHLKNLSNDLLALRILIS